MAKKTFEEELARLEEIAELMDSGEQGLEQSVKLYKEGIELAIRCKKQLDGAVGTVSMLKEKADGSFVKQSFPAMGE